MPMFPAVCHQFAHAMGKHTIIPSTSIDESTRLLPLNVVTKKKKRRWIFFHKIEYSTYDFSLHDLLIDRTVLESKVEESKFCTYNREISYSLKGKFGAKIRKDIMDASLSAYDKLSITAQLGELILREIGNPDSFMTELDTRKLDMKHQLIKQIHKDKKLLLCVVIGVITTADKAEIFRTDNKSGNIEIKGTIGVEIEAAKTSVRDIVIEPGTVLAYKVWELKVNVNNGAIIPVMTAEHSGGFSSMDASGGDDEIDGSNESSALQNLQSILQPLHDCTEADTQPIKSSLLVLMRCSSDVVALSKILSKAENGNLKEEKDTVDKQFINKDTVWSILKFVGVQSEEGTVLYEREATPILTAVAYVIDAVLELEDDDLDKICHCNEPQLKTLSKIFESAVASSMPISMDVDKSSVLDEPVSSFLTNLDFTVFKDDNTILPPETQTCIVECIFCVLYCLS